MTSKSFRKFSISKMTILFIVSGLFIFTLAVQTKNILDVGYAIIFGITVVRLLIKK